MTNGEFLITITWRLSQTSDVVSKGWDAAHYRVLTWIRTTYSKVGQTAKK